MEQAQSSHATSRPEAATSRRGFLALCLGLLLVCVLYGEELVHYKHSLYGFKEYYVVRNLNDHPGCTLRDGNPRELTCPMRGFNSLRLGCLSDQCIVEDQNAVPITPELVARYRAQMLQEYGRILRPLKTYDMTPHEESAEELHRIELEDQQLDLQPHANAQ